MSDEELADAWLNNKYLENMGVRRPCKAAFLAGYNACRNEILEVFVSESSGDDLEMAECAREIMEMFDIRCYRHGKVVSKLTKAKELLKWALHSDPEHDNLDEFDAKWKEAEQFLKG